MRWTIREAGDGRRLIVSYEWSADHSWSFELSAAEADRFGQELKDAAIAMVSCKSDNPRRQPREGEFK